MAIQKNLTLDSGVNLTASYIKIDRCVFNLSDDEQIVSIIVCVYKDSAARTANKTCVAKYSHNCSGDDFDTYFSTTALNVENNNFMKSAYQWLMTLSNYSGGMEV